MASLKEKNELLYFALRNNKLRIGLTIVLFFLVLAIVGPMLTEHDPTDYVGPGAQPPSAEYPFGTTTFGQDVFTQFVRGLGSTFLVGLVGGGIALIIGMVVGFVAGYRGGLVDEALNMLTNVVIVIPTLAVLLIIAAAGFPGQTHDLPIRDGEGGILQRADIAFDRLIVDSEVFYLKTHNITSP